jgi:hypothetical protein
VTSYEGDFISTKLANKRNLHEQFSFLKIVCFGFFVFQFCC